MPIADSSDDDVPFWRLFDALPKCHVLIEQCPVSQLQSSLDMVLWEPKPLQLQLVPAKRDMVFRPRGEVSKQAVLRLGEVVSKSTGVWGEMESIAKGNPRLEQLRHNAVSTMVGSKANSTLNSYLPYTVKWSKFCEEFGFQEYPASNAHFIFFIEDLIGKAKEKRNKSGVVTTAVYAVDFVHGIMGLPKPGAEACIKLMLESARKALARPTVRKKPLTQEVVWKLIKHFVPDMAFYTLNNLRFAVYCALAFVLEARFMDIIDVCPNNIVDYGDRMVVFLEMTKTDQYREGAFVPFMNSGEPQGAYALVEHLLDALPVGQEGLSIFRRVGWGHRKGEFFRNETMSYTLVSDGIKEALGAVGEDPAIYGLHSFRSGAKSHVDKKQKDLPVGERIPERLSNKHGRWTGNSKAALGYNEDDSDDQLLVPTVVQL